VRELTGGRGVDCVVEVGGAGTLEKSIKSIAASGQISLVGGLAKEISTIDINVLRSNIFTLRYIAVGSRAQFIAMNRAIAVNGLKPIIDRVFPFENAHAAYRYYEDGQYFGKVIISQS
jgi:NADPH:quinone reductase-like Zn-dependent oxidoreductase